MSFKIIALEVLKGCGKKHSKNLKFNEPYLFYKNYVFLDKQELKYPTIHHRSVISESLYNLKDQKLDINISAIVGKNGSGKSTIVELLMKGINNLFYRYKDLHKNKNLHAINKVPGNIELNIYYHCKEDVIYRLHIKNTQFEIALFKKQSSKTDNGEDLFLFEKITSQEELDLSEFFYTEVINYSLYSYNSIIEGPWIKNIFHKNDAYQTPIVLNPFRKEGIIDINSENDLIFQRLLSNILRKDDKSINHRNLGDNLRANAIVISNKLKPVKDIIYYDNFRNSKEVDSLKVKHTKTFQVAEKLIDSFLDGGTIHESILDSVLDHSKKYITCKVLSIVTKYNEYKKYFNSKEKSLFENKVGGLVEQLLKDNSHITFKLKQALNYLKYNHVDYDPLGKTIISIPTLSKIIDDLKVPELGIMSLLPSPVFSIDLNLNTISGGKKENITFNTLSSGEKQLIYSINSLFYHLINLYSVVNSSDNEKISYNKINIILEEIELYFHPDFQRRYINLLIEGLDRLELKNLSLNFIFVTHSPFILSDIPSTNVMYLDVIGGESTQIKENKRSFGANIHELLGNNFFFNPDEIYIGEFAKNKINQTIEWLKSIQEEKLKLENFQENYFTGLAKEKGVRKELIEVIDEPIIKAKLLEMYAEVFGLENKIEYLEREKKRIELEIEKLTKIESRN